MYSIDRTLKPKELRLMLKSPKNKQTVDELHYVKGKVLTINFGKINELTFSIPYKTEIRNRLVDNPHLKSIREKQFIKAIYGGITEWFLISKISKSSSDTDVMNVQCYGLGYQLWYRKIIDYMKTSINLFTVATDCVQGTGWKVGYINPEFNLKYREFDVSSKRRLEFIYEMAETFEAIPVFDSINKTVNFYKEEELSLYKGMHLTDNQYIESIDEEIDIDQVVTRLHIRGGDNLTINSVNPTGKQYIDDFSYLIYPYEEDEHGAVIKSSKYLSDELCSSLIKYNVYVTGRKHEFANLLQSKKDYQLLLTTNQNDLSEFKIEYQTVLDSLSVVEKNTDEYKDLVYRKSFLETQISNTDEKVIAAQSNIGNIENLMNKLKNDLELSRFLSDELQDELYGNWIQEDEWTDENKIDPNDLYEAGIKRLSEINKPPINTKMSIVNFFSMISEKHNWERFSVGDIVKVKYKTLNVDIKTTVTEMTIDIDNDSIDVTISNQKQNSTLSPIDAFKKALYTIGKVNTDYNRRKVDWKKNAQNFNLRNDRFPEKPNNPFLDFITPIKHVVNDNGTVNLQIQWNYKNYDSTKDNHDNIDGFFVFLYASNSGDKYTFGSKNAFESLITLEGSMRTYTFTNVVSNMFYSVAIQAYRAVDEDINSDGVLMSDLVYITDIPYLPSTSVDIKGRVNGVKLTSSDTPPVNPSINDRWTDTSGLKNVDKSWNGTSWIKITPTNAQDIGAVDSIAYSTKVNEIENAFVSVSNTITNVDTALSGQINTINNKVAPPVRNNLSLQNSWRYRDGYNYTRPSYTRDSLGIVRLYGLLEGGATGSFISTLPSGFRPPSHHTYVSRTGGNSGKCAEIVVYSSGEIKVESFEGWLSLDGIQFQV